MVFSHRRQANEILARVKAGGEPLSRWESRFIQTNRNDLARLVSSLLSFTWNLIPARDLDLCHSSLSYFFSRRSFLSLCCTHLVCSRRRVFWLLSANGSMRSAARSSAHILRLCGRTSWTCARQAQQLWPCHCPAIHPPLRSAGEFTFTCSWDNTLNILFFSLLSLSSWGPNFRRKSRIVRHLQSIVADDVLLAKEGMGDRLTNPELLEALEERGM